MKKFTIFTIFALFCTIFGGNIFTHSVRSVEAAAYSYEIVDTGTAEYYDNDSVISAPSDGDDFMVRMPIIRAILLHIRIMVMEQFPIMLPV